MFKKSIIFLLILCLGLTTSPIKAAANPSAKAGGKQTFSASSGSMHVIKQDGSLWAWGSNHCGLVGDGTTNETKTPIKVMDDVISVSARGNLALALKKDGSVWSWGAGALGSGESYSEVRPNPQKIMDDAIAVEAGDGFAFAIKKDQTLWGWGSKGISQPSFGDYPQKIMDNIIAVSAGDTCAFAITDDNRLLSWGTNFQGQLGRGEVQRDLPANVVMEDVVDVSSDGYHTLAIKTDGSLWSWGYNNFGAVGDGTTTNRHSPVRITDKVSFVEASRFSSFAIKADGTLWGWGSNSGNEFAFGDSDQLSPIKMLEDVVFVNDGYFSWAIKNDGTLWQWGTSNRQGPVKIMDNVMLPESNTSTPTDTITLTSSIPENGNRKVSDSTLSLTFSETISRNLNWSAGSIEIKDYESDKTVLTFDSKTLVDTRYTTSVSGSTIMIKGALESLEAGKRYYVVIPKGLIVSSDGSKLFNGYNEYQFDFTIDPSKTSSATRTVSLPFRGTTVNIGWNWNYFSGDATKKEPNNNLAIAALTLSAESKSSRKVEQAMKNLGFDEDKIIPYYYDYNQTDRPAIVIGSIKKTIDGNEKCIIVMAVRGSTTLEDWVGTNFGSLYNGFTPSADYAKDLLKDYIKTHFPDSTKNDRILFITGHSMGGGVAGSLALRTDDIANRSSTFVYTFASTNYRTDGYKNGDYSNVINYINTKDIVPHLPIATGSNSKVGRPQKYTYLSLTQEQRKMWDSTIMSLGFSSFNHMNLIANHLVETYMAFLLSNVSPSNISSYIKLVEVHCPVDVKVFNSNGTLMASTIGENISYSDSSEVAIYLNGDGKDIYMPSDGDYRVEITGTGTGTMTYTAQDYNLDTNSMLIKKSFSNVEITNQKNFIGIVTNGITAARSTLISVDSKGNKIEEIHGETAYGTSQFTDVKVDAYYYEAVLWAVGQGITVGTSPTTFSPNNPCTRAQAVTFLWRAAGSPKPASNVNPFTDVKAGQYYTDAVLWAVEKGITSGTSATTFSPNVTCSRAQIVTFQYRAAGSPGVSNRATGFTDVASGQYYEDAVKWAVEKGVTAGTSATTFSPNANCTRGQIVTFLYGDLA